MKPLSSAEFKKLTLELHDFSGAQLQEARFGANLLSLGFYQYKMRWLIVDLTTLAPQIYYFDDIKSLRLPEEKKPLVLFLRAHFVGHRLHRVSASPDLGRILRFEFREGLYFDLRLFPRGANVLAYNGPQTLSLHKPLPLSAPTGEFQNDAPVDFEVLLPRSLQWANERQAKASVPGPSKNQIPKQRLAKLQKAIAKISEDIELKRMTPWREVGDWLKLNQTLAVPIEWQECIQSNLSLAQNIELVYAKAKERDHKIQAAHIRREELSEQLRSIEKQIAQGVDVSPLPRAQISRARQSEVDHGVRMRTVPLNEEFVLYIGKSAEHNMALLREAKPWSYWLHLRDIPSCHGLIHRNKNKEIPDSLLHKAAQGLLQYHLGPKWPEHKGEKFDVIIAECRYVKPIKGDRLGRVNYSHEKTLRHLLR